MTEREKFIRTFSHLHASDETLTEVLNMAKQENPRRHTAAFSRRAVTLALAAALLLALGVTAYAVGLSIHAKRQEELRNEYQVEENHVNAYREYETPEEAQPGVTLLAAYNDGQIQHLYLNISPVEPEELRDPFMQDRLDDGRLHYLSYELEPLEGEEHHYLADFHTGEWEYAPEELYDWEDSRGNKLSLPTDEAKLRRYLAQSYDAETKTATLETHFWLDTLPEGAREASFRLACYDNYEQMDEQGLYAVETEKSLHREYGSFTVEIVPPDTREFRFPEPLRFPNQADGGELELLGLTISATGVTWQAHLDDAETILGKLDTSDEVAFHAAFELQLRWINLIDQSLSDAELVLSDGERLPIPGYDGNETPVNGDLTLIGAHLGSTIDVNEIIAVEVAGQTIEIPQMESAPLGG